MRAAWVLWAKSFAPMMAMPTADKTAAMTKVVEGICAERATASRATKMTLEPIKGVTRETSPR